MTSEFTRFSVNLINVNLRKGGNLVVRSQKCRTDRDRKRNSFCKVWVSVEDGHRLWDSVLNEKDIEGFKEEKGFLDRRTSNGGSS